MGILVTGAAGFIGFHVCQRLLARGEIVVGIDNLNPYYEVSLKQARLAQLEPAPNFLFYRLDISDRPAVSDFFTAHSFDRVIHLAAQAGVRYSLKNPHTYVDSNLVGFVNILEGCRQLEIRHLVFASSSSVYGASSRVPFSTQDSVDHPISLYAATKKANELLAHSYSHLYRLPITGLRFFTVYGPWGRPDMAPVLFTKAILAGQPIQVFNYGKMKRDFTYVDDVVEGVIRVLDREPSPDPTWSSDHPTANTSSAPYRLYNIGNHQPVELLNFIEVLEASLERKAVKQLLPMQPGEVLSTYADVSDLMQDTGFQPSTPLEVGVQQFVGWYRQYYQV
ncbi:MAG TPA: NAD-dependent epimerase [Coleofasciculaceae cyanobacterium]